MEKQVVGRFLLGAGLGGLVGTGVLALVSVSLSGPFPQQRSAVPAGETTAETARLTAPGNTSETGAGAATQAGATPAEAPIPEAAAGQPPENAVSENAAPETGIPASAAPDTAADTVPAPATDLSEAEIETEPSATGASGLAGGSDLAETAGDAGLPVLPDGPELAGLPAAGAVESDPALEAALDAAFAAGDGADAGTGTAVDAATPAQPAGLADAASDPSPEAPLAPEASPEIAGIPGDGAAELSPPAGLTDLPEPSQAPDDLAGNQTAQPGTEASAEASRPASPAEDSAPALVLAPEPPPLTEAEELMLAQIAADELLADAPPVAGQPVLPANDDFVILDQLPPQGGTAATPETVPAQNAPETATAEAAAEEVPAAPAPEETAQIDSAPEPEPQLQPQPEPAPAAVAEVAPDAEPEVEPGIEPEIAPEDIAQADPAPADDADAAATILSLDDNSTLPGTGTGNGNDSDAGVETQRLPRIGDAAPDPAADPVLAGEVAAEPRHAFARPFENAANKPRFAVILIDDGSEGLDRTALADLPFAVSFAIDPQLANAAEIAAIYRAAGQEVIMLGSGLPKGAAASDIAVAFDAMARALPESVAVMDLPSRSFQGDRALSSLVVPEIEAQGRGLITWNIGLNAADQVAKREDVPSAVIFRDLDAEGEDSPVIRRYLDRAAFKAAQEGAVTVLGRANHPPTLAALLEWAVEGRAASVELAPVTAMLTVD